jgi:trimethylamine--corrinoid protein Co-methyltransferase
MIDPLTIDAGGRDALVERPRAVFDVCPSPPLTWSEFACRNVMDLARAHVPAELISMPLAGVAAPVTLIGSIVQHAAETLAGIVLHQLAEPGAPIVWGGAPSIVDMRSGSTPMGAIETAMIDGGYAAVGKSLGMPVHAYLGATDSKLVDAQAGYESGMTALVGGLAGIDMISGPGMLDFLLTQSPEKLVLDADMIGMVQRLLRGVGTPTETLATASFEAAGPEGRFLELQETRKLFRSEQYLPSRVFDRDSRRAWLDAGGLDAYGRAHERVEEIMATHVVPALAPEVASGLVASVRGAGAPFGLGDALPGAPAGLA